MAGNLSTYAKGQVRKWAMTDSAVTRPTGFFLALYTGSPDDDGGGTEVSDSATGYARQEVVFDSDGEANDADVTFGPALTNWGDAGYWALFTSDGDFWMWGETSSVVSVTAGKSFTLPTGSFSVVAD